MMAIAGFPKQLFELPFQVLDNGLGVSKLRLHASHLRRSCQISNFLKLYAMPTKTPTGGNARRAQRKHLHANCLDDLLDLASKPKASSANSSLDAAPRRVWVDDGKSLGALAAQAGMTNMLPMSFCALAWEVCCYAIQCAIYAHPGKMLPHVRSNLTKHGAPASPAWVACLGCVP